MGVSACFDASARSSVGSSRWRPFTMIRSALREASRIGRAGLERVRVRRVRDDAVEADAVAADVAGDRADRRDGRGDVEHVRLAGRARRTSRPTGTEWPTMPGRATGRERRSRTPGAGMSRGRRSRGVASSLLPPCVDARDCKSIPIQERAVHRVSSGPWQPRRFRPPRPRGTRRTSPGRTSPPDSVSVGSVGRRSAACSSRSCVDRRPRDRRGARRALPRSGLELHPLDRVPHAGRVRGDGPHPARPRRGRSRGVPRPAGHRPRPPALHGLRPELGVEPG